MPQHCSALPYSSFHLYIAGSLETGVVRHSTPVRLRSGHPALEGREPGLRLDRGTVHNFLVLHRLRLQVSLRLCGRPRHILKARLCFSGTYRINCHEQVFDHQMWKSLYKCKTSHIHLVPLNLNSVYLNFLLSWTFSNFPADFLLMLYILFV